MITAQSLHTPAYDQFEMGTLDLHALIREGQEGSAEADELRELLEGPWASMTPEQRRFGNGLSADLYMLNPHDGEVLEPPLEAQRSAIDLGLAIKAAWDRHDWADALNLLRREPRFFPPEQVAYLRARAYDDLGSPLVALAFIRHAMNLEPAKAHYEVLEMSFLTRSGRMDEATSLALQYLDDRNRTARVVSYSASHLFQTTRNQDPASARPTLEKVARVLRTTIERLNRLSGDSDSSEILAYAHLTLGASLESLGEKESARNAYDAVLNYPSLDSSDVFMKVRIRAYIVQQFEPNSSQGFSFQSPARSALFDLVATSTPAA